MWWLVPAAGAAWLLNAAPAPPPPPPTTGALWKPGLWAIGVSATTYVGLAAIEGLHNRFTGGSYSRTLAERRKEYSLRRSDVHMLVAHRGFSLTVVGLNLSAYFYCQQSPLNWMKLADSPQRNFADNWTLLTAAFCHKDPKHFSANMSVLVPEIPHLLQACGQSPYQFVAFYISAAILSSYAQRVVSYTRWSQSFVSYFDFTKPHAYGASGVAMAVFAASCFTRPLNSPSFVVSVSTLGWQVMNDIEGLLHSNEMVGFAAHLAGAVFGATYAYFNASERCWRKLVRHFGGNNSNQDRPRSPTQAKSTGDLSLDELVDRLNSSV